MTELRFSIPRVTGTHADVLLATGLGGLLASGASAVTVRLREEGAAFEVSVPDDGTLLNRLDAAAGYRFLRPRAKIAVPEGIASTSVFDYEDVKQRIGRYHELRQAMRQKPGTVDDEAQAWMQANEPPGDWRQWQVLNLLQGFANTNRVFIALNTAPEEATRAVIAGGLEALRANRPSGLNWGVSSVQLFNPNAAKGYARLKPDTTDRNDKTKEAWVDSFLEWLRYRGYFLAACPYYLDRKAERIRILCPIPADISVAGYRDVVDALRAEPQVRGGEPKVDAVALLTLARLLIERSEFLAAPTVGERFRLRGRTPARVISGVAVTQYQSLGSARAVSQLANLAVPDWFRMESAEDARAWLAILEEHRKVVSGLQDDRSDEVGLALGYRRFLQKRGAAALDALTDFMGAYGAFLLRAREQRRRVASFTTTNFGALVRGMNMGDYVEILDDPGFRAVAAAVRRATVSAQSLKAQGGRDYREIRYDLLHEIRRKRSLPDTNALVETVADFVASYNYENARRREMKQSAPRNVTTEELRAFASLVERYKGPLVGALLAAYGSCREPREDPTVLEPTDTAHTGDMASGAQDQDIEGSPEEDQ